MTLQLLHSEFPYIWGKFDFIFYQCTLVLHKLENLEKFLIFFTARQGYILFHLSHQPNTVGVITFNIVDSILKFSVKKKYSLSLHLVEMGYRSGSGPAGPGCQTRSDKKILLLFRTIWHGLKPFTYLFNLNFKENFGKISALSLCVTAIAWSAQSRSD